MSKINTFTIITGSGRCGTSALVQFFSFLNRHKIDMGDYFGDMRAGLESVFSIQANKYVDTAPKKAEALIGFITKRYDIVKTPTFFISNSYHVWKEYNQKKDLKVLLLRRDNLEDVFSSAQHTPHPEDWDILGDIKNVKDQYNKNIQNLEKNNILHEVIEFPRFTKDPEYLFEKLSKLGFELSLGKVEFVSKQVFNPDLTFKKQKNDT